MKKLLIIGAGGHGKVVADIARQSGQWREIAFLDDRYSHITKVHEWPVLESINMAGDFLTEYKEAVIALGNNRRRMELLLSLKALGYELPVIKHPSAAISYSASIAEGTVIFPQAVVNINTCVKAGAIINSGAVIEHDCLLEEGVHISPNATLAGGVYVGKYSWIGIGATVIENRRVGNDVLIGAGAVVIDDISDGLTVAGVPAKVITNKQTI